MPRPDSGSWQSAGGIVLGDQFSLAWRVLDAQFWGVAQRRKRIFLVADFGGTSAGEILFKQDSLLGDTPESESPRKGTASPAKRCADHTSRPHAQPISHVAFAANQRDEVRDLNDVAGALGAQPGMKQQTFVANCLTPWDTQQDRIFTPESTAPTLAGADGGGGRNPAGLLFSAGIVSKGNGDCFLTPERHTSLTSGGGQAGQGYPCVMTAGFCAGAGPAAGGIGFQEECAPTLKASESGTNMVPSILCLNDQGGKRIDLSHGVSGTLRADERGHQPLVMATQQGGADIGMGVCPAITAAAGTSGNNQPVLFENHGIDSRYTGPHEVAPTMSARYGTGGNNVPLVAGEPDSFCIAGNIIDREVQNGGNGIGCQPDISYTLNTADRHAVFSRQRSDVFRKNEVVSTQTVHQGKDATDLVAAPIITWLKKLIRCLTPLECERLQGFPDYWTDIPGASDSARYKALGNSVAIPCVDFVLRGVAFFLQKMYKEE